MGYVFLPFEQKAVVGAAVLPFVVEAQKAGYVLLPFEEGILVVVVDGMGVLLAMDGDCIQICSCLAVSQSPHPSQLSETPPSQIPARQK